MKERGKGLWGWFADLGKNLSLKITIVILACAGIYLLLFLVFYMRTTSSMREKIVASYDSMLSLYVSDLSNNMEYATQTLLSLGGEFDVNTMAISEVDSKEYILAKFRIFSQYSRLYQNSSILDSLYIYDRRSDRFLMIPNDGRRYQEQMREEVKIGKAGEPWHAVAKGDEYALAKLQPISDDIYVEGFVDLTKLAREMEQLGRENGLLWSIATINGEILYGDYEEEAGSSVQVIERHLPMLGLVFRMAVRSASLQEQNSQFRIYFLCCVVSLVALLAVALRLMEQAVLRPLDRLVEGMHAFAFEDREAYLTKDRRMSQQLWQATHGFNEMVYQIKTNRLAVYQEKMQRQKLMIQNLQFQINPHFFSNTLNLIYNLNQSGRSETANRAIMMMSSYYRYITSLDRDDVRLEEEIHFVEIYLDIMKLRFPRKLTVVVMMEEEVKMLRLPPMVLQPLVENSLQHGFVNRSHPFAIEVWAEIAGEVVRMSVRDTGVGFPPEYEGIFDTARCLPEQSTQDEKKHVGVKNIYQRLLMYYRENVSLTIGAENSWTCVEIQIRNFQRYW